MIYVYSSIQNAKLNIVTTFNQLNMCQFHEKQRILLSPVGDIRRQGGKQNSHVWGNSGELNNHWHAAPPTKIWTLCGFSWFLRVLPLLYHGGRWRHNITCIRCSILHSIISQLARGSITICFLVLWVLQALLVYNSTIITSGDITSNRSKAPRMD
jgi:hypothetical protein